MPTIHIQLFGHFQLCYAHQPVTVITKRGQILLAYLLLYRHQAHLRETLASLLWPETNDVQARANLRTELTRLRRSLAEFDRYLYDEHGILQWRHDAPFTLDVLAFEQASWQAEQAERIGDDAGALIAFQTAINLYSADLLANVYEDWVMRIRQCLANQFIDAMDSVIALLKKRSDYPQAIRYAQRLLQYDPLHETCYRQLMEIHALNGDHAKVKQVYQACVNLLQRELAVLPSPLTQKLYQTIMAGADDLNKLVKKEIPDLAS
ncbi:hypothetical protein BH10CHL1_BH10CHL1_04000 [soil metagenome]